MFDLLKAANREYRENIQRFTPRNIGDGNDAYGRGLL